MSAPTTGSPSSPEGGLLGASQIRELADRLGIRPTKQWGQNFVVDANTVRRIVRVAEVTNEDHVVEVGPGLGSLTLALLETGAAVTAIEVDPVLAQALPETVERLAPQHAGRLTVVHGDALAVTDIAAAAPEGGEPRLPTALVANLPYNVSVPVVLSFLEHLPTIERVLVMVQLEVAERLAAKPGSKTYGVPSVKAAWWSSARLAGQVSRSIFWPVPGVDSGLVSLVRREPPATTASRQDVFACVDAAFAQRRKTLRAALRSWAGSAEAAEAALVAAGIDPRTRGEQLDVDQFAAIASALADTRADGRDAAAQG
ncbi:16S rRNA (adenine(1518)-N(6)/adenine(1519)-N(6))-dimethyltransferase RsmA [Janibacter sp. GXQ6167]|uniref:16S rRNA (adenine(1518)-N(6)/adenine(1519)-N(6))- dimethyltransferase RsmA n=1 Tax=Janibacter sp. GXQ6167 TaxID=3240791 RepID=UPI003523A148